MNYVYAVSAFVVFVGLICISSYISSTNYGARTEALLEAEYQDSQNVLANYEQKVLEAVQVPDLQKQALVEIVRESMTGRYGETGSKAMFQVIAEQNLQLDQSTFRQILQIIEAGRNDFAKNQRTVLDVRREYVSNLNFFWTGAWLSLAGYPKVDLTKYDPVITVSTQKAFETKKSAPLKLK